MSEKKRAAPVATARPEDAIAVSSAASSANKAAQSDSQRAAYIAALLDLFGIRCHELAHRVRAGVLSFIDAVDIAYEAAIWSGLSDAVGDDRVQAAMREAFMGVRKPKGDQS
jgi:hypothetical protein